MKNPRIALATALVAVALTMTSCGWLFGPSVDQVTPDQLEDYTASTTFQDQTENGVLNTTGEITSVGGGAFGVIFTRVDEEIAAQASITSVEEAFNAYVARTTEIARSRALAAVAGPNASITVEDNSTDDTLDRLIEVVGEEVTAADVPGIQSGTATVDFFLDLDATVTETSNTDGTTTVDGEGQGDHNSSVSYVDWSDGNYTIHQGRINTDGSGSFDVDVTGDPSTGSATGTASWQFGLAMSAGFSVSRVDGTEGGKIILDYTYNASDSVTVDGSDAITDATSEINATLLVVIYDNDGNEVVRREYTSSEAAGLAL